MLSGTISTHKADSSDSRMITNGINSIYGSVDDIKDTSGQTLLMLKSLRDDM
jgi:hypothetical protein